MAKASPPAYRELGPGLLFGKSKASYGVRMGNTDVLIVKADPKLWALAPYSQGEDPDWAENPADIRLWTKRIPDAAVIVNGGQYYKDGSSMGYLSRGFKELEPRSHKNWKGYAASGPQDAASGLKDASSLPYFSIIDLEIKRGAGDKENLLNYRNVLQSFMVIDRMGGIRVKNTDHMASRAVIGEDKDGSIIILTATGALTLYDAALILKDLEIFPAIGLDGGVETQLAVKKGASFECDYGEYSHNAFGNIRLKDYHPSLPFVAALVPLKSPSPTGAR
jgi:hypothetical protein